MSRRALFKTTVAAMAGLGLTRPVSSPARAAGPLELSGDAVTTTVDFEATGVDGWTVIDGQRTVEEMPGAPSDIDKEAQFLYVAPEKMLETAELLKARSYDAKGAEFTHRNVPEGEICSFVTLMRAFGLRGQDPALDMVGKIVNHADTRPETSASKMPEGEGLEAIAHGFAILTADDHQKLEWELPMYDALYAFCQRKVTT